MLDLPSGTVTFLFTDIEGSTRLLHELRDRYGDVLEAHARLLRAAFEEHDGREIDTQGDSFFIAFKTAKDALAAAVAAQRNLAAEPWPDGIRPAVRMGMHTGEPSVAGERYLGLAVHRASRICSAAHGGQILLSGTTADLVADELPAGMSLRTLGEHNLKDFERAERIFQVGAEGLPVEFPPLASGRPSEDLDAFRGRERELAEAAEAAVSGESGARGWVRSRARLAWAAVIVLVAVAVAVAAVLATRGDAGGSDVFAPVPTKSLALIDPARNTVAGSVPLGGSPTSLASDGNTLWILNPGNKTLLRVDASRRKLVDTIGLGAAPNDVVAAAGEVWITGDGLGSAALLEITPTTNAVSQAVDPECCVGFNFITGDDSRLWMGASDGPELVRFDPEDGRIGPVVCCSVVADAIAFGEGALWAVERDDQLVARMDPDTGAVEEEIPFGAPLPPPRTFLPPAFVSAAAAGEGGVWVVDSIEGLVWQIDPVQNSVKRTIPVGAGAKLVTTGFGSVWVGNAVTGTVTRIDASSGRVLRRIKFAARLHDLAVADDAVWVSVP
jgi:class 3 adenylate cyclase/streptogramin lyase